MCEKKKIPCIIDCDPGVDDILALILAKQCKGLDVRAITAVAGNVEHERTLANALKVTALLDWDVPVARGAEKPMCGELITAAEVHGKDGMLGVKIPDTDRQPVELPAWDLIWQEALKWKGELELIVVGPFTNIGIALVKYPELPKYIKRIVVMGGAFLAGNTTPAAEFNVIVDPEAAEIMLHSGIPVYLCPLDVTHKAYITQDEAAALDDPENKVLNFFSRMAGRGYEHVGKYTDYKGVPLHDPCAVLFTEDDSCFTYEKCSVVVETGGEYTRGKTVTDLWSDAQLGLDNAYVVYDIDREAFLGRIRTLLEGYKA